MPQLLIELFSEEIPARMQSGAARDLERMASERLKAAGLTWEALTTFAGPRRLTLVVEGLPVATPDRAEEIKGPRTSAPDQALDGFLRKTGLTKDQLIERDGLWFAEIKSSGRATAAIVPEMVEGAVRNFPWPKSMRWGSGTLRWVRPLKRIVAVFDGAVVPFAIDGIESDAITEGHRFLGKGAPIVVNDFADYRRKLEADYVLLDVVDRKLKILEAAKAVCAARGLALVDDDGLLEEVAGLAEWPTPILGEMDPQFLSLPPEVVRLSMKVHQKYFAVSERKDLTREDGSVAKGVLMLSPHFVVVANVEASDGGAALAAGNSRVLSARLNDAQFFWDEDQKVGFDAWLKKLEGVTFHAKLGTMAERVDRIAALAREIAPLVGADPDEAEQAARLAKADLASAMVGEFPELQGVMGGYYARLIPSPLAGEGGAQRATDGGYGDTKTPLPPSPPFQDPVSPPIRQAPPATFPREGGRDRIADAVRDHYKPQGPADSVPTAPVTVAVALADKLDTLVGFFAIGEKPTGSKDPFALRRAALGVIRLVLENVSKINLDKLFRQELEKHLSLNLQVLGGVDDTRVQGSYTYAGIKFADFDESKDALLEVGYNRISDNYLDGKVEAGVRDLLAFFADRLKVLLRDQGKRHDLVDAVFALGDDDLVRIVRRVEALDAFLATDDGANLLAGYRRASNILKAEVALAFAVAAASSAVETALEIEDFAAAMTALAALRAPVDDFFTDVLVNSDVATERDNRLKLLGQVRGVMGRVADFGLVAG